MDEKGLEILNSAPILTKLMPHVFASVSNLAKNDPPCAVQILSFIQDMLPSVAALNNLSTMPTEDDDDDVEVGMDIEEEAVDADNEDDDLDKGKGDNRNVGRHVIQREGQVWTHNYDFSATPFNSWTRGLINLTEEKKN